MPKRCPSPIELIPEKTEISSSFIMNVVFTLLIVIIGYFVYKLFNKFNDVTTQIETLKQSIIFDPMQILNNIHKHSEKQSEETKLDEIVSEETKVEENNLEELDDKQLVTIDEEV
jgi:predicted PurR-regulated permease PerM